MKRILHRLWIWFLKFALDPNPLHHEDHDVTRNMK